MGKAQFIDIDPAEILIYDVKVREVQDDKPEYQDMVRSISTYGIKEPVLLTVERDENWKKISDKKVLIDGLQRTEIAKKLGLTTIPARFDPDLTQDDCMAIQSILNDHRIKTSPADKLNHFKKFMFMHPEMTQTEVAAKFCIEPSSLSQILKLERLIPAALALVAKGSIKQTHAFALAGVPQNLQEEELPNAQGGMPADRFIAHCKALVKESRIAAREQRAVAGTIIVPHPVKKEAMIVAWHTSKTALEACDVEHADHVRLMGRTEMIEEILQVDPQSLKNQQLEKAKRNLENAKVNAEKKKKLAEEALAEEQKKLADAEKNLEESLA